MLRRTNTHQQLGSGWLIRATVLPLSMAYKKALEKIAVIASASCTLTFYREASYRILVSCSRLSMIKVLTRESGCMVGSGHVL